jgi:O-antigen/teichoic acid export membrane protein
VQIAGMVQQIPQVAGQLVGPRFVAMRLKNDTSGLTHFIQKKVTPALWAWSICCILGSILVSWQGPNWIPAKYMILTDLVWPLAAVTAIVPVWYIVWSPLLTAYDQVRVVMWSSILTGAVNLSANLILIPRFGVVGSAWATVLAYSGACLLPEFANRKSKSTDFPQPEKSLTIYSMGVLIILSALSLLM